MIKKHNTHVLEYGDTIIPVTVTDSGVSIGSAVEAGDGVALTKAQWPEFENDIRELLGIPKHRPSRAKTKKQD